MHHQVAMSVIDSFDDVTEELNPFGDSELLFVTPEMDRLAFHKLHDEVRPAFGGGASIEKFGDVRMIERSKYLAFLLKTGPHGRRVKGRQYQLDGGLAVEDSIGTLGEIDRSHAASSEFPREGITTDDATLEFGRFMHAERQRNSKDRLIEPSREIPMSLYQPMNFSLKILAFLAFAADESILARAVHGQSFFVDSADQA